MENGEWTMDNGQWQWTMSRGMSYHHSLSTVNHPLSTVTYQSLIKKNENITFYITKRVPPDFEGQNNSAMMLVAPTMQLIILPLAANFEVKNVNVAYIDHDRSSYSQKLENKIASSGYFKIAGSPDSYKQGLELIEYGNADLVLEIPVGFEKNLVREGNQKVNLSVDAINGTKAALGGAYLVQVLADFNSNLDVNIKSPKNQIAAPSAKISVESINWYNPRAEYNTIWCREYWYCYHHDWSFITLNIVKEKR